VIFHAAARFWRVTAEVMNLPATTRALASTGTVFGVPLTSTGFPGRVSGRLGCAVFP
jgi:hypothetical protein